MGLLDIHYLPLRYLLLNSSSSLFWLDLTYRHSMPVIKVETFWLSKCQKYITKMRNFSLTSITTNKSDFNKGSRTWHSGSPNLQLNSNTLMPCFVNIMPAYRTPMKEEKELVKSTPPTERLYSSFLHQYYLYKEIEYAFLPTLYQKFHV